MKINQKYARIAQGYLFMMLAGTAYAMSTTLFLAPNAIIAGGMAGIAVMINMFNENVPIGLTIILLNLPIYALALKFCGFKLVAKCLLTVTTLGVITDLITVFPGVTNDPILASLYGGVCQGIGIGLFVKYEFSSGGTELMARLICGWIKASKIPIFVGILDGIIVITGAIVTQNINNLLYALIVIFVSTKVSEVVLVGLEKSKFCLIITDKGAELSDVLIHRSPRGVTMLEGEGMYTHKQHNVVMTCVKNRQLTQLKQIVSEVDKNAFIIINDSIEVRGKGFQSLQEK